MTRIRLAAAHGAAVLALGNSPNVDVFVGTLIAARPDLRVVVVTDTNHPWNNPYSGNPQMHVHVIDARDFAALAALIDAAGTTSGCVMSWPRRLPDTLIARFGGHLFNLHSGDLPRYRGAGGRSWQVLNGETEIKAHVQQMASELDRGPLLFSETEALGSHPTPRTVQAAATRAARRSLVRLASAIALGDEVTLQVQDEDLALYFPRLSTADNGWIDFSWRAEMIERFIRAFSDPYAGASFRYGAGIYRVRHAMVRPRLESFHPFCIGLVVNRTTQAVAVAAQDGVLHFEDIVDEEGAPVDFATFAVGGRCWSSAADLGAALRFRPGASPRR